jgi:Leucine-rich repeat (LRR) protein
LSSADGDEELYKATARVLHCASRECQTAARAGLRHLSLDRYFDIVANPSDRLPWYERPWLDWEDPEDEHTIVPWDLLEACPALNSLSLHPEQLGCLLVGLQEEVPAAVTIIAQLKHLDVSSCGLPDYAQDLGRLLWACSKLENVHIRCNDDELDTPWLLVDPNSSSCSNAVGPPLPLRSLTVVDVPAPLVTGWIQQQGLGRTLRRLDIRNTFMAGISTLDADQLTGLVHLEELRLERTKISSPQALSSMASLTRLELGFACCRPATLEAACALTTLRHLSVNGICVTALPDAMQALKQLTCLKISTTGMAGLPADLGVWCPGLACLEVSHGHLAAVPASLGSLTRLNISGSNSARLVLPTTLVRLKDLDLSRARYRTITGISSLAALERLDASDGPLAAALGGSLAALQPLTRLRHLSLSEASIDDKASFSVIGALQQLTHLDLSKIYQEWDHPQGWAALAGAEPLPALEQLDISTYSGAGYNVAVLEPWISQLSALTQLIMGGNRCSEGDELLYLPTQLQQLDLSGMVGMQRVPLGLQPMSALRVLDLSYNQGLYELPGWFSQLCCLEELDLEHTSIGSKQQVLACMPALRCVRQHLCDSASEGDDSDGGDSDCSWSE